jgi:hypothetical protein
MLTGLMLSLAFWLTLLMVLAACGEVLLAVAVALLVQVMALLLTFAFWSWRPHANPAEIRR